MPTFTSSAMNPNGSYQADGMDASDQANFNLQNQRQQQSMMAQLALAQLRSGDARFAAERSDNMGMAGINALSSMNGQNLQHQDRMAEMQASANRDKAQFGYLQGRDTMADNQHQREWKYGTDPSLNPMLKNQQDLNKMQTDLAAAQLKEITSRQDRANAAQAGGVTYAPKTTEGTLAAGNAAMSGAGIAQQGIIAHQADLPVLRSSAEAAGGDVGTDISSMENRAGSWSPFQTVQPGETGGTIEKLTALKQKFIDAGDSPSDAEVKVKNLVRNSAPNKHWQMNPFSSSVDPRAALYKALKISE